MNGGRMACASSAPCGGAAAICGGTMETGEFTKEGWALLDSMAEIGFPMDIAHMNETLCPSGP